MRVDEGTCGSMKVDKGRRWFVIVVRVHESG